MRRKNFETTQKNVFYPTTIMIVFMLTFLVLVLPGTVHPQDNIDQGFIYGEITLRDGEKLQGPIRWGTEETLWHDMFNSAKEENEFSIYLSDKDMKELRKKATRRSGFLGFLERLFRTHRSSDILPTHQFICRFGEIKKMEMKSGKTVFLTFKNGDKFEFSGGSNDINAKINILDRKKGEQSLKWNTIRMIEFMPAPLPLEKKFGEPLYGTVETRYGEFTGFIQWDHQECLDTDKLDGEWEEGDISIEFGKIKSIEKYRRGSLVTLHSGRDYYIYGTNDVNDDNRGIIINDFKFGKILVDWDEFDRVEFEKNPGTAPAGYNDFFEPRQLTGKVTTKEGNVYAGRMVYDLDETMDFELISGYKDDIEYKIPLRNIEVIEPLGSCCSRITLKNGKTIELEDERDVNGDNDGFLVWNDEEPEYISWRRIRKVEFN